MNIRKYSLKKIESMPTLHVGQYDDLKLETKHTRVWLSRMTVEDGMEYNNQVTIEEYRHPSKLNKYGGRVIMDTTKPPVWETVRQYQAK